MAEKESLKFSASISPQDAAGYLESLARGIREGQLVLESGNKSLGLELASPVKLELAAECDADKSKSEIELSLSWQSAKAAEPPPSLLIVPGAAVSAQESLAE